MFRATLLKRMLRICLNDHFSTLGQIFKISVVKFLYKYKIWHRLRQDLSVFPANNGFVKQRFENSVWAKEKGVPMFS